MTAPFVEKQIVTLGPGVTQVDVTLTQGQIIGRTVPLINGVRNETYDDSMVSIERLGATQYRFRRFAGVGTVTLELTVLEWGGATITEVPITLVGTSTTAAVTITNMAETWAVSYARTDTFPDGRGTDAMVETRLLTGPTRVEWRRDGGAFGSPVGMAYVCEDTTFTWSVQTVTFTVGVAAIQDTAISAVNLASTFHIASHIPRGGFGALIDRCVRTSLLNSTTFRADRTTSDITQREGTAYVVNCDSSVCKVQRGSGSMANAVGSETLAISAVVPSLTSALYHSAAAGCQGCGANSSPLFADPIGRESLRGTFPTATQLTTARADTTDVTDYQWEVVEWQDPRFFGADGSPVELCECIQIPPG